ncbi:MAG: DUF342 domain-containing protein [Deltaproteobacteria bacterium]|nr:DUF342 domain-containing protein [Deltaproteobacteria bacterium]
MDTETKIIAACPNCHSEYRVPVSFEGKLVSCKKCGTKFKISVLSADQQKPPPPDTADQVAIEEISPDASFLILGKLALQHGFITKEQLKEALLFQKQEKEGGRPPPFGQILLSKEMISQNQLNFLLSVQKLQETRTLDIKFGQLAIINGFVTREDVDRGLKEQKRIFSETNAIALLGDILINLGSMTEDQRDAIVTTQKRFQQLPPDTGEETEAYESGEEEEYPPEEGKETELFEPTIEEKAEEYGIDITISEDRLEALLALKKRDDLDKIPIEDIKELLEAKGVTFGIVDDNVIIEYFQTKPIPGTPLKIAQGQAAKPGQDARINYTFDTDPLKIGVIKKGGVIDFKDRGEIPQVKPGDLIAEKIPALPGTPGTDVYGHTIPAPKSADVFLRCDSSTKKDEDGLKAFAQQGGAPQVSADGMLSVMSEHYINGDVGLETGHIEFDGHINVSGSVQDGFRVKGGKLSAKEILKAEIDLTGDIDLTGGILGAHIKTGGSIKAKYINASTIEAWGDVVVNKEVYDSTIEACGKFVIDRGKVLTSRITAKKGIEAVDIGSELSNPCTLMVGVDVIVPREVNKIKEEIGEIKKRRKELESLIEKAQEESSRLNDEMMEFTQMQDQSVVQKRSLEGKIEELRKTDREELLSKAEKFIEGLDNKIKKATEIIEKLVSRQDQIMEEVEGHQKEIEDTEKKIEEKNTEIQRLIEWSESEKAVAAVKVSGKIFPGTIVRGAHSSLMLEEKNQYVLFSENKITDPESRVKWEISISTYK